MSGPAQEASQSQRLEQQLREAAGAIQALQGRMAAQEAELVALRASRARVDTLDTELGLVEPRGHEPSSSSRGLVDTRQLGRPEKFNGEPATFEDWSFVFEAYMSCVDRKYVELFEKVRFSDVPWFNRTMSSTEHELSVQLYYTLALLLQGRALDICQTSWEKGLRPTGNWWQNISHEWRRALWVP